METESEPKVETFTFNVYGRGKTLACGSVNFKEGKLDISSIKMEEL